MRTRACEKRDSGKQPLINRPARLTADLDQVHLSKVRKGTEEIENFSEGKFFLSELLKDKFAH